MRSRRRNVVNLLARDGAPAEETAAQSNADAAPSAADSGSMKSSRTSKNKKTSQARSAGKAMKSDESKRAGAFTRLRRMFYRPKILLPAAVLALGLYYGPQIPKWLPNPENRKEYQFATTEVEISPPPRDVPPNLVRQVIDRAKLPETMSIVGDDLTQRIAQAFAAHPWVENVVSVRKSFPPRVVVDLEYRRPVAMVEVADGMYPVDQNSVLLPPEDFSLSDTRRYPVIRGVQTQPQGPAGLVWGDVAVQAAARVAVALRKDWDELQLHSIVVPKRTAAKEKIEDLKFTLQTRGGSRILWGRAPGTNHPGELTAEQKIGRLRKYLSDFGQFDRPHGPYEIDIRHWQEITRRPLVVGGSPRKRQ